MNKARHILGMALLILLLAARVASALVPAHECHAAYGPGSGPGIDSVVASAHAAGAPAVNP